MIKDKISVRCKKKIKLQKPNDLNHWLVLIGNCFSLKLKQALLPKQEWNIIWILQSIIKVGKVLHSKLNKIKVALT